MLVAVILGTRGRVPGSVARGLSFLLTWPSGTGAAIYDRARISGTIGAIDHVLGGLEPEVREQVAIKAVAGVWAKSGGVRRVTLGKWEWTTSEPLPVFVRRSRDAFKALPPRSHRHKEDGWIDESDLGLE